MITTGMTAAFEAELAKDSRKPIQVASFITPNTTYHLCDHDVSSIQGIALDYEPWIESWGTLNDSVSINDVVKGGALEIRTCSISIINCESSRAFIRDLMTIGVENTKVRIHQIFFGLSFDDAFLIDEMVCQDPITLSEASMLLKIDLVSVLMEGNPYLWPRSGGEIVRDIVIGKATGVPLIDLQTARITTLVDGIAYNTVGQVFVANGVGFPGSGNVYIGDELVSYSWITAAVINITGRGRGGTVARPHSAGEGVTIPGAYYDYALCAGPVASVDNLIGDGLPYPNPVTFYVDENPVIARFINRPPWLKINIESGDPYQPPDECFQVYASSTEFSRGNDNTTPGSGTDPMDDDLDDVFASSPQNINSEEDVSTVTSNASGNHQASGNPVVSEYSCTYNSGVCTNFINAHPIDSGWIQTSTEYTLSSTDIVLLYKEDDWSGLQHPQDGIEGGIAYELETPVNGPGDFSSLQVELDIGATQLRGCSGQFTIILRRSGDADVVLFTEDLSKLDTSADYVYYSCTNQTLIYNLNTIQSFDDLNACDIYFKLVNVTMNVDLSISQGINAVQIFIPIFRVTTLV